MLLHRQAHRPALGVQQLQAAVGLGGKAQLIGFQDIVTGLGFGVALAVVGVVQCNQVRPRRVAHQRAVGQQQAGARRAALAISAYCAASTASGLSST
ncbi:hypothetical protein G6F22_019266 [Rhizopus arrhizus]|nr:hypothetical protein G6F22_019266 [Rhizopus arrhizus]